MDLFDILDLTPDYTGWPYLRPSRSYRCHANTAPVRNPADISTLFSSRTDLVEAENREYDLSAVWSIDTKNPTIEEYVLRVVIAPYRKAEVDVQIDTDALIVQSADLLEEEADPTTAEQKPKVDKVHIGISEKHFKVRLSFARLATIVQTATGKSSAKVAMDRIKASVNEGVLEVHIPIDYASTARTISLD